MTRRRRLFAVPAAILAAAFCLLCLLAAGTGAWIVATPSGSTRAIAFAAGIAPDTFSYARVEGTLARRLVLHGVELRFGNDVVRLDRLALKLRIADLISGRIGLEDVEVTEASYVRGPASAAETEPRAIVTPIPLAVHGARVAALTIKVGGTELLFTDTAADGRWSGKDVELDHIETKSAGFEAEGRGRVVLAPGIELAADLQWSGDLAGRRFAGDAAIAGTLPELAVQGKLASPFSGGVTGRIETVGEPRFDLDFEWTDFDWPGLAAAPASPTGTLAVSGIWSSFEFETKSRLVYAGEQAELAASGQGAGASIGVERFTLETAHGTVAGAGTVELAARTWDLTVASDDLDSGRLFPDWRGRGRAEGRFRGRLAPALEWSFEQAGFDGVLRGHPFRASGSATYRAARGYVLENVRIESGRDVVSIAGSVGARRDGDAAGSDSKSGTAGGGAGSAAVSGIAARAGLIDLTVSADIDEIGAFLPEALDAGGRLTASFKITGSLDDPRIEGTASAVGAKLRGYRIGRVTLVSKLGVDASSPLEVQVRAFDLLDGRRAITALEIDALEIDAAGTLLDHRVTASARSAEWTGRAAAAGAYKDGSWQGRIRSLAFSPARLGTWSLEEAAELRVGRAHATLSPSCLAQDEARICAALDLAGRSDDRLRVTAERFDLASLAPFLPGSVSLRGVYAFDATFTNLGGAPSGSLDLTGGKTRIEIGGGSGRADDAFATEIDTVSVSAQLERGRLALQSQMSGRETGNLRLDAVVDDVRDAKSPVHGELRGEWPDLAFLAMLSPSVGRVGGSLSANLAFGGTLDAPAVEGKASWRAGTVSVPDWGLVVEHIEGEAASADGSTLEYRAAGRVGDGELTLRGVTKLEAEGGVATSLTLRGDSLRVVQLPEAEIYASPDLAARVKLPDIYVDGTVTVPRANITLETLPAQAASPSSDTVLHGGAEAGARAEQPQPHPLHLHSNIRVVLGDAVKYAGANLDTTLTGQLQLAYDTGRSATAAGRLNVAGSYSAYGQSLKLDRGELLFNGPIDNPALDVRAVRTLGSTGVAGSTPGNANVSSSTFGSANGAGSGFTSTAAAGTTVGIELTGMLRAPKTRIFSMPAMSEADALSYLIFGRPLRGTGGTETATLQTAAISMGLQQALPVVQRIGETLGLDELTVGATDTDAGALMAGKYLSPKVYIRYSYGLFNRIGGLLLRFKVNDRLSLETRSGDEKSMDLLYTVEKK